MQGFEKILEEIEKAKGEPWYRLNNYDVRHKLDGAISRIVDIIRKHMNDGWIPVEKRIPINHEGPVEVTVGAGYRTVGYYDEYREGWWTLDEDSILDVIAWKEPSEPYHPERSEGE